MEKLNQNQLILLTLLVSFVTSIATGIITVSLLQEAPVEVTRNINRIVERTIETVAPIEIGGGSSREREVVTVVVKEEDLIMEAIQNNLKSIVRINEQNLTNGSVSFYSMGVVLDKNGHIMTAKRNISHQFKYTITTDNGTEIVLTPVGSDKNTSFAIFKAEIPQGVSYNFVPAKLVSTEPSLGQTIIGLGGTTENSISVGRISSFNTKDSGTGTSTIKVISGVENDVSSGNLLIGSPFFNLSGEVIGMKVSSGSSLFIPSSIMREEWSIILQ